VRVKDLQQYLSNFTAANATGTRQGNAISNAILFVEVNGYLHEIRRMEVHEHAVPYLGHTGSTHRLVMKTERKSKLIIPTKLKDDY
jgi:hypothetical protein